MLFTQSAFWIFFGTIFLLLSLNRIFLKSTLIQNVILLLSSYFFYSFWDYRFLGLIILCTLQTFYFGRKIFFNRDRAKTYLYLSVTINLLVLGLFKYFNFFYGELINLLSSLGAEINVSTLSLILPVGISFYIFQSLTYVIDIYKKEIRYETDLIKYSTFVAFFPQLVAGPIERASNLLPQFHRIKSVNFHDTWYAIKLIIFGLFLKVFIADNLAGPVNFIFSNYSTLNGGVLALGAIYFSVQIYGDFCGYSTIAIGVAKLIGYDLMVNFKTPYLSTNIQDFWRRWHISLSTFFRDYVFIPLGGSRVSENKINRNILITFTISGIWHGANWTFMFWGFLNGIGLIFQKYLPVINISRITINKMQSFIGWFFTMFFVAHCWIFFRSETIADSINYIIAMYTKIGMPNMYRTFVIYVIYMLLIDFLMHRSDNLRKEFTPNKVLNYIILSIIMSLYLSSALTNSNDNPFIYFQF